MTTLLRASLDTGTVAQTRLGELPVLPGQRAGKLSLVDDDTIEHEILSSRLALAMMDRASWEFTDLRSRMNVLESREELDDQRRAAPARAGAHRHQLLAGRAARLRRLARAADGAARRARRTSPKRPTTRPTACCSQRNVLPEVDLRPFIRRSQPWRPRRRRAPAPAAASARPTGTVPPRPDRFPAVGDEAGARPRLTRSARRRG